MRAYRTDNRIKCGINMDGSIRAKDARTAFSKPFLFLIGGKSHVWNRASPLINHEEEKLNPKKVKTTRYQKDANMNVVTIADAGHSTFLDVPLLLNTTLLTRMLSRYYDFGLEAPSHKASAVLVAKISPHIVKFFEKHLKDRQSERFVLKTDIFE